MDIYELLLIGLSLSMDAFAISVTNGAAYGGAKKQAFITALAFGLAQGLMPLIGYLLGSGFSHIIASFDHWVAFALLLLIGGKMLRDGLRDLRSKSCAAPHQLDLRTLLGQAVATSIDALAIGVSFAALRVNIVYSASVIAAATFFCCLAGGLIGCRCGRWLQRYAVLAGGIVLILIGIRILLEHLGILA